MKNIFSNIDSKIIKYISKSFLTLCIFISFISVLNFPDDLKNYVWEFMVFSFLGGASILSINSKETKLSTNQIGSFMVFTSILLLVGYGISKAEGPGFINGVIVPWLSVIILFVSIFLFSFALSELTIELGKNIFPKKINKLK
ncbi:MAG: hypothetical protein WCV71_04260 [Patescibacteria group bacterium]